MLKKILLLLVVVLIIGSMLFAYYDKPLPQGEEGPNVQRLTDKMLAATNYPAWDSTVAVGWSFYRGHNYLWDKKRNLVEVNWDDRRVLLNTIDLSGLAYKEGVLLEGNDAEKTLRKAWKYFANDSFWLAAPFKIQDPGTQRSIVKTDRGDALLVQYTSGGVTPGDSYLWFLDDNGLPIAWKLWVGIVPIGGVEFSWESWEIYATGARLSSQHNGLLNVEVSNIKLAMSIEELNNGIDPFKDMP